MDIRSILAQPKPLTSSYLDGLVMRHRQIWHEGSGRGPFLAAIGEGLALAKINFDDCPTMVHVAAKTFSLLTQRRPSVVAEEGK